MSAVTKTKMTEAEYLEYEEKCDFRNEFYQGEVFAMAGASGPHNRITENLSIRLGSKLWGGECQSFSRDMRIKVDATTLHTYPDFMIVCGEPKFTTAKQHTLLNPKVLVEVLSPSRELYDRTTKFENYKQIPSLMEYVLIAQDRPLIESYVRQSGETWIYESFSGLDKDFSLRSLSLSLPMAEIYAGVTFPEPGSIIRVAPQEPLD